MRTLVLVLLVACGSSPASLSATGERWEEADALFRQDPRWLGGDGAYSIDLGGDRTLWLFGDSFIATSPANVRSESRLVRNSVAVMTGRDPLTATMDFAWRESTMPSSFFAEDGDHWFWPVHGVRLPGGPLIVFLAEQRPTPGQGLGFDHAGWRAVRITNPDDAPAAWTIEPIATAPVPGDPEAALGACTAIERREGGDYLVALAVGGGAHDGRLARWRLDELTAGDLTNPQWWTGQTWTPQGELTGMPAVVVDDGATECSLTQRGDTWVHLASRGFGASTLAIRTASPAITGPYSEPTDVMTPPESEVDGAFVYAGKGHPQLDAGEGHDLVVTYANNSFTFADLFDPARADDLYWPHVARFAIDD